MSQATGLNVQDSPIKSVNTITDSLNISDIDLNLSQQSMDLAEASSPNAVSRKRSKRNSCSGKGKAAVGEPQPKTSSSRNHYPLSEYEERELKHKAHAEFREGYEKVYKFFVQEPGAKTTTARLRTIVGDLFQSSDCLAHCVAEDVSMSAGIAKEFAKRFPPLREFCWNKYAKTGQAVPFED